MADDELRDRLTKAIMDAMGCKCDHRPGRPGCRNHTKVVLYGVIDCDWPCPVAVRAADALLPFVRDEVADELDLANTETCAVLRRIWTDPKDREVVDAVEVLLEQRADEVRRG